MGPAHLGLVLFIFATLHISQSTSDNQSPIVETENGKIRGHVMTSRKGRKFSAFHKIPYAAPPVGELRFKDPQSPPNYEAILDGTKDSEDCIQKDQIFNSYPLDRASLKAGRIVGSEDCLYLNVYSPILKTDKLLPVIFSIHGGAFVIGSGASALFGPQLFMDRDVVLVTINYRLGLLGFLSLESDDLKGNMGLKDQLAALKWVKRNIHNFGGDPNSITIVGESAGAASVHLQMSSHLAKGLFQRAISQSGSKQCPWAVAPEGVVKENTIKFAQSLGCPTDCPVGLLSCLREKNAEDLLKQIEKLFPGSLSLVFRPVIEEDGSDSFLTMEDYQSKTTVPWITGVNSGEGLLIYDQYCLLGDKEMFVLNQNYKALLPAQLFYDSTATDYNKMTESIKKYYVGDKPFNMDNFDKIMEMYADGMFIHGHRKATQNHSGKLFKYYYAHRGERSFSLISGSHDTKSADHADELLHMFYLKKLFPNPQYNEKDEVIVEMLLDFWTNFATFEDPTPQGYRVTWEESVTSDKYLHIGTNKVEMKQNLFNERMQFWDKLMETYVSVSKSKDEL